MTVLETPRLTLRPFTTDDIPAYARIRSDPDVVRYLPGGAAAAADADAIAAARIPDFIQHWREHGFGLWAVIERDSNRLVGHCGLLRLADFDAVEVLYMLDRPAWGRGIATEAARASMEYGFRTVGLDRIVALVLPENRASARVIQKLGMVQTGNRRFKNLDVAVYERLAPPKETL